jgi:hypothetical protein
VKKRTAALWLGGLALVAGLASWAYWRAYVMPTPFSPSVERGEVLPVADYRFSGPYTHENLTLYLVHGRATLPAANYLTLQEALEQNKVIVHETEDVNRLSIENASDEEVFVQAGDVVKGGKQDRTFPYDFIAPARSGKLPIDSFCVEQGRWGKRGEEEASKFSYSSASLAGNDLKIAARSARSQGAVWDNVQKTREKVATNLGRPAAASESTSYQLATEAPDLRKALAPYLEALRQAPDGKKDVLGVVIAVNGKIVSAEVYASGALFAKLWPKLLDSAATEAFAEMKKGEPSPAVSVEAVKAFLREADQGPATGEAVTERVYVQQQESGKSLLFDTCDRARNNVVIHRTSLAR